MLSFLSIVSIYAHEKMSLIEKFGNWANEFKINLIDEMTEQHIFYNWIDNHKFIEEFNNKNLTYKLAHNQFSGMDENEFKNYLGFKLSNEKKNLRFVNKQHYIDEFYPESFNWIEQGFNQDAQDQGQCGSCWTFSTSEALSGAYFVKYDELVSFSKQQLVDCDNIHSKPKGTSMGCNGGQIDGAFKWMGKNGGLCLENDYQYVSGETKTSQECKYDCDVYENSNVVSYTDVKASSDDDMMSAIYQQPVSVAIQADQKTFQLYKSGILTDDCGTNLDHAVLVVGYGSEDGLDYYMIKNSWGTSWGCY